MYRYVYIHICIYIYKFMYRHMCRYTHVHTYKYLYIHTCKYVERGRGGGGGGREEGRQTNASILKKSTTAGFDNQFCCDNSPCAKESFSKGALFEHSPSSVGILFYFFVLKLLPPHCEVLCTHAHSLFCF